MIVIADDITGAAEIAGLAFSYGLSTELQIVQPVDGSISFAKDTDVHVLATDTRSMTAEEAILETNRNANYLLPLSEPIFKKTDSALRGHIVEELKALMETTSKRQALFVPANPSKGRIIKDGIYYIKGVALAETAFSYDPEYPASTSSLSERFPEATSCGINMPDATSVESIQSLVASLTPDTIPAGAIDLFEAYIKGLFSLSEAPQQQTTYKIPTEEVIIVCGSTQSQTPELDFPISSIPIELYDSQTDTTSWQEDALKKYKQHHTLILNIPYTHRTGKDIAVHLRNAMAMVLGFITKQEHPREIIIEGGATAYTILSYLKIHALSIVAQIAPGVIRMRTGNGVYFTIKPGSYPWGNIF